MIETAHRTVHGDSRTLAEVPGGSVHLVVTSPPYPMIEMWDGLFSSGNPAIERALHEDQGADAFLFMHEMLDPVWRECHRVLVPGGIACINVGDATRTLGGEFRLYTNHARVTAGCEAIGFRSLPLIHWRKATNAPNKFMGSGMLPGGAYVTLEHEYVLLFRKEGKRDLTNPTERSRRARSAYFWEERNRWFSDVWDLGGTRQGLPSDLSAGRRRSAAFPFELALRLIQMYSLQEDTVLDPFNGTGTTQLAAAATCRSSVGVDSDNGLVEQAKRLLLGVVDVTNAYTSARLASHEKFVSEQQAAGRSLKHVNRPHGVPVKTRQETELTLMRAISVAADSSEPPTVTVRYEPWNTPPGI